MARRRRRRSATTALVTLLVLLLVAVAVARCGPRLVHPHRAVEPAPTARRAPSPSAPVGRGAATAPPRPRGVPSGAEGLAASLHVALGVPTDADPSDDVLLDRQAYVVSYNPDKRVPNWVAWHLDRSDLGRVKRRNDFRADHLLPSGMSVATPADYVRSGYDRGHLCPSADRDDTAEHNSLTFLMTNMVPQLHELNAGPWEKLEEHERELAAGADAELFLVAGGIFAARPPTIGRGVAVPRATFKIIVALRRGERADAVTPATPIVAVAMPNERWVAARPWTEFVTSVDELERETGYDFLSSVREDVQAVLEARVAAGG